MVKNLEIGVYVFFFIISDKFVSTLKTTLSSNSQFRLTESSSVACTSQQVLKIYPAIFEKVKKNVHMYNFLLPYSVQPDIPYLRFLSPVFLLFTNLISNPPSAFHVRPLCIMLTILCSII